MNIEYTWKVWLIEDGKHEMHFSNYKCVQADGSTFFIIAPNSTVTAVDPRNNETYALNDDILENLDGSYHFSASGFISTGEMNDISSDDLPPFPDLLGFPEKITNSSMGLHVSESVHEIHHRSARGLPKTLNTDFLDPMLSQQMLSEGEAQYEDNLTLNSFPHPDFLPLQPPGLSLGSPDYLITEEGQPGESGSAAARDQSVQQIGAFLSEDEDHILEEAGKPRTKSSDTNSVLVNDPYGFGDPLRDNTLQQKPSTPHLVNRPKILLSLDNNSTTTGFVKQYLILKPGALKVGNTYLFQVNAKSNVGSLEGSAIHYFKVNVGPTNGRCTLMPIKGYSMNFYFGMHCLEWKSDHQPLYYELSYSFVEDDPGHLIYFGLNRNVKFVLPAGYPSNTYNVYLNVVVRDSIGAATKVCSLARMVEPLPIDSSLERYIYNETFHPGSELKKLLGAKRNQAVLHRIHVLSSSLNNVFNDWFPADPDRKILREKIRLKYFEVINNMKILNMVEAVQVLSVLSEIISDVQNVNVFALQKAYNIYLKIYALRSRLYGSYASSKLQYAIMVFLSKLGYATQSNSVRNHELNSISREYLIDEIKEIMMTRYKIEDPIEIIVPHIFIRALYLLKENRFFLPLKQTKIKIDGFILKSRKEKSRIKRCQSSDCLQSIEYPLLIAQEFDYITMYHNEMLLKDSRATIVSIALALLFDDQFEQPEHYLNFSVYFPRNHTHQCINKTLLMADQMNVHQVNITKSDLYHSLLFHVKLNSLKRGENRNNLDILFRYENMPTLQMYDMKISSSDDASELSMFIPQENIKAPGMYYFAILNQKYEE
ncbi:Polycystic kidney disease protein 1-like 1, partial [Stegodyphus mimosarum]